MPDVDLPTVQELDDYTENSAAEYGDPHLEIPLDGNDIDLPPGFEIFNSIDAAIEHPEAVLYLNLSEQGLTEVPEEVRQFVNLQELELWENELTELPDWIGELSRLRILYLDDNNIETLPESLGGLERMQIFSMSDNKPIVFRFDI